MNVGQNSVSFRKQLLSQNPKFRLGFPLAVVIANVVAYCVAERTLNGVTHIRIMFHVNLVMNLSLAIVGSAISLPLKRNDPRESWGVDLLVAIALPLCGALGLFTGVVSLPANPIFSWK